MTLEEGVFIAGSIVVGMFFGHLSLAVVMAIQNEVEQFR